MGLSYHKKKVEGEAPVENAEVQAQVEAATEAPEEAQGIQINEDEIGSLSDKVHLVSSIGFPLRDDRTTVEINGEKKTKVTSYIVGYTFRSDVDLEIPDCGTNEGFVKDYMNYNDINGKKTVKAGEEFDLTLLETGILLSDPRFNRIVSVDGVDNVKAVCCYAKRDKMAQAKGSGVLVDSAIQRIALRLSEGSIKDFKITDFCTKEMTQDENGTMHKTGHIVDPRYEKFAVLCAPRKRSAGGTRKAATGKKSVDAAAIGFLAGLKKKGYVG